MMLTEQPISHPSYPIDAETGFEVNADFERFNQQYDIFNRSVWDDAVRSDKVRKFFESYFTDLAQFRKVEGFTHRDYALRNAVMVYRGFHGGFTRKFA
jgi:hypothetical protein